MEESKGPIRIQITGNKEMGMEPKGYGGRMRNHGSVRHKIYEVYSEKEGNEVN